MQEIGFFLCLGLAGFVAYTVGEFMEARRRGLRREFLMSRPAISDREFQAEVSVLSPVPLDFVRAFRLAVARALGVEAAHLAPQHRLIGDLRVINFDAVELATVLERTFDTRVRVVDLMRRRTLRELCKLLYERSLEISEYDPPLFRDPRPKLRADAEGPENA